MARNSSSLSASFCVINSDCLSLGAGLMLSDFAHRDLSQQMHNSMYRCIYPHMTYKFALLSPFFPAIDSGGMDAKNPSDNFTCHPETA